MNKIIEIDGVKYELVKVEEQELEQPKTLHDLIVQWVDDDNIQPVKDLIERIEKWLPKEIQDEPQDDEWDVFWNRGYNFYRTKLIEILK